MLAILLFSPPLLAHRVNIFAYQEGKEIKIESYFSDGTPARDSKIEVYTKEGEKILEGRTDEEGMFSFPLPSRENELRIVLLASMGHRAETTVSLERGNLKEKREEKLEEWVEKAVEKGIRPLIKLMEEERRRVRVTEVLGGIGYILGITGIAFYLLGRKK